ncbi:MAG: deaminase [Oscillospiraceae bacterium]|nr:deaminase [Oscillospiraceae bacterium]
MVNIEGLIIGLTGAFGSGCSFFADNFLCKKHNFSKYSLSEELKKSYKKAYGCDHQTRRELQDFGNGLRKDEPNILANKIIAKIKEERSKSGNMNFVVDSIRNPTEIAALRKEFPNFILIAMFADYSIRWGRVKNSYGNSKDEFDEDELRDQGNNEPPYGQQVSKCFFESDLILSNNEEINTVSPNKSFKEMENTVDRYLKAFEDPTSSEPTINESLMAIAYTIGRRSKCMKRKVGAIIVDNLHNHNILSSGFNGVPRGLDDCKTMHGECYRDVYRSNLKENITKQINSFSAEMDAEHIVSRIKVLELCRSLHAEENSLLNLVGVSKPRTFENCSLYATTYPCNLCANKIVQAGIKKVIYFEPYPVEESKEIFKNAEVETEPFEGITFRAFFRAFNFVP